MGAWYIKKRKGGEGWGVEKSGSGGARLWVVIEGETAVGRRGQSESGWFRSARDGSSETGGKSRPAGSGRPRKSAAGAWLGGG